VHHKTANLLSIQNLYTRNTGSSLSANRIKKLTPEQVDGLFTLGDVALAVKANLSVMRCLEAEIKSLEQVVKERVKLKPAFRYLLTVSGIGQTLALTIMLETGDIGRFPRVGNFASYCRCVGSEKISNGKRKGKGTPRTAISISVGRLWKRPTLPFAMNRSLVGSIRERKPRHTEW
jgi:transposase